MDLIKSNVNFWIKVISVVLAILVFTLGEIALNDIENKIYKVKNQDEILTELQSKEEKEKMALLVEDMEKKENNIKQYKYQIDLLDTDITSKKSTLEQLLENQKVSPNSETQNQISLYQKEFLSLQSKREKINSLFISEEFELNRLKREIADFEKSIRTKYDEKLKDIKMRDERNKQIKVLITQFVFILFLFVSGILLLMRFKKSSFFPPVLGYNVAIYVIIAQAIYVHSPFKLHYYVFILIGIIVCIIAIIWLIKNIADISKKQNINVIKKSLALGKCPNCSSEISLKEVTKENYRGHKLKTFIIISIIISALIGNSSGVVVFFSNIRDITLKEILFSLLLILLPWIILYFFITILTPFKGKRIPDPEEFNNNACTVCGLVHIIKCDKCGKMRHNLLPYCGSCASEKLKK